MQRLLSVLLASLLVALAAPVTAYAGPADDAKQLLTDAATVREEMIALSAQIDELESQIGEIDPTANNAADALPLLAEAKADYAEQSEKAASVAALMDEIAALDVSEEMKTYAGLRKQFAESWIEFCALEIDGIGKLEILFDPGRMSELSQADQEKLVAEATDFATREAELRSQVVERQQAMTQYAADTDFPEESVTETSTADGLIRGTLVAGLIFGLVFAVLCGYLARRKNRSVVGWAIFGFLLPVIALILVAVLPTKQPEQAAAAAPEAVPPSTRLPLQ